MRKSKMLFVLPVLVTFFLDKAVAASNGPRNNPEDYLKNQLNSFLAQPDFIKNNNVVQIGGRSYYVFATDGVRQYLIPAGSRNVNDIAFYVSPRADLDKTNKVKPSTQPDVYDQQTQVGRALNNNALTPEARRQLAAMQKQLEQQIYDRAMQARARIVEEERRAALKAQEPTDEANMSDWMRRVREDSQRSNMDRIQELAKRDFGYEYEARDLVKMLRGAISGLANGEQISSGSHSSYRITDLNLDKILTVIVKNLQRFTGYFDDQPTGQLKYVLGISNLSRNVSGFDWSQVPTLKLSTSEKIVDIGYIYSILEKIRTGVNLTDHEVKVVAALMINFTQAEDRQRFFSLIYGYQARQNMLQNLKEATLDFSKGLEPKMLRLFLVSLLRDGGFSDPTRGTLTNRYEKIMSAKDKDLPNLLADALNNMDRDLLSHRPLSVVQSDIINRLVFLKVVQGNGDTRILSELEMTNRGRAIAVRDVEEYVQKLRFVLGLDQQSYIARQSDSSIYPVDGIRMKDITSEIAHGYFLVRQSGSIRSYFPNVKFLKKLGIQLPDFFLTVVEGGLKAASAEFSQKDFNAEFMIKNRDKTFETSSGSGLRCEKIL